MLWSWWQSPSGCKGKYRALPLRAEEVPQFQARAKSLRSTTVSSPSHQVLQYLRNLWCNHKHWPWIIHFQRKVQWCCWGTTPKGAKWILEQYCILDSSPQVRRPWKPSLWGCFFGGGRLQIVRGIDNQNQTLVVNLSQQSTGKKQKKGPSGITFSFPLHSKINSWWCR